MYNIPPEYLTQPEVIPDFWRSTVEDVNVFLDTQILKGSVTILGNSAGGRALRAVCYGKPRQGRGTSTFSGALGFRDVRAYLGPDYEKRVYMAMGSIHGAEFEGIVGLVNLLAVLETGRDLRGKAWPEIVDAATRLDRIILLPITNPDGRARVPLRMQTHHGQTHIVQEYLNTGGQPDGSIIGWPQCKEHIPLDFSTTQFPGGYPNDAGVNIQHDDFFGQRQPETQALFDLTTRERPDLILNMHTGAPGNNYYTRMHRPFAEPSLTSVFEALYRQVHTRLAVEGLQSTPDLDVEADPAQTGMSPYNLDTALNLHCGVLSVVIESPCHGFSGTNRAGEVVIHVIDAILDAQLICHQESMKFLVQTGGRWIWARK